MVLCLLFIFLAVNFDWSIILIRKSFGASRHISGNLRVKLAIGGKMCPGKGKFGNNNNYSKPHQVFCSKFVQVDGKWRISIFESFIYVAVPLL